MEPNMSRTLLFALVLLFAACKANTVVYNSSMQAKLVRVEKLGRNEYNLVMTKQNGDSVYFLDKKSREIGAWYTIQYNATDSAVRKSARIIKNN